eukprot:scaffold6125_cov262-Ochromonas_danica.AAC.6
MLDSSVFAYKTDFKQIEDRRKCTSSDQIEQSLLFSPKGKSLIFITGYGGANLKTTMVPPDTNIFSKTDATSSSVASGGK